MNALLERLKNPPLVGDGAMGTQLFARGLKPGASLELWNATNSDAVREVCQAYVDAGADVICTNTFGGSSIKLKAYGLQDRTAELNRLAVEIAVSAAGECALVWASIGPSGALFEPIGDAPYDVALASFREQAEAQAQGGAHAILVESMLALEELRAAVEGAKQATDLPVFATMSFSPGGKTVFGVSPQQLADAAAELGCAGVGVNCGDSLDSNLQVFQELARHTKLPLVAQPNAGKPQLVEGKTVFPAGPEEMAAYARRFVAAGAAVIGACCGSTPAHIKAIAEAIR